MVCTVSSEQGDPECNCFLVWVLNKYIFLLATWLSVSIQKDVCQPEESYFPPL